MCLSPLIKIIDIILLCICRLMINILVQFVVISWFTWQGDTAQRCWLTDWSPEDWIHHVNERALLSSACLLPHFLTELSFSCFHKVSSVHPLSPQQAFLQSAQGNNCGWCNGRTSQYSEGPIWRHIFSNMSSFCCQPFYLCVSAVPAQVQTVYAHTFCLVLCCTMYFCHKKLGLT